MFDADGNGRRGITRRHGIAENADGSTTRQGGVGMFGRSCNIKPTTHRVPPKRHRLHTRTTENELKAETYALGEIYDPRERVSVETLPPRACETVSAGLHE